MGSVVYENIKIPFRSI